MQFYIVARPLDVNGSVCVSVANTKKSSARSAAAGTPPKTAVCLFFFPPAPLRSQIQDLDMKTQYTHKFNTVTLFDHRLQKKSWLCFFGSNQPPVPFLEGPQRLGSGAVLIKVHKTS
jgi:hypothetical protein